MTILCTIDLLTREVFLPADQRIAAYDHNVDVIRFQAEPIEDFSLDLSTIRIAAQGPNKARHDYAVDPSTVAIEEETGYITFDWPIPQGVTEMPIGTFKYGDKGQLIFAVCAEIISGSTVSKAWHSDDGIITVVAHLEPEAGGGEDPSETATNAQKIGQLQTDMTVVQREVAAVAGGTPTVVDAKADMTEHDKIYILSSDGKWYYYSETASDWLVGGTYGGAVTDTTLSISGKAADAKAVGDALAEKADSSDVTALDARVTAVEGGVSDLKSAIDDIYGQSFNYVTAWVNGEYIDRDDGTVKTKATYKRTDYIEIEPEYYNLILTSSNAGAYDPFYNAWYDSENNFISNFSYSKNASVTITPPTNAKYFRLSCGKSVEISISPDYKNTIVGVSNELNDVSNDFETYKESIGFIKPKITGWINGKYVSRTDGTEQSKNTYHATDFIAINPKLGNIVLTSANAGNYDTNYNVWYDENKEFISNFSYARDAEITITPPLNARYFRLSSNKNVVLTLTIPYADKTLTDMLPENTETGNTETGNYVITSVLRKENLIIEKLTGKLTYSQSFCIYDGKYYSTNGTNISEQDATFAELRNAVVNVGHGNALQLGHNGKAYASGWNDNRVYIVDLATLAVENTIILPTTGYTTCAIDDLNSIAYIFQRDTYPDNEVSYNFIAYDYANGQTLYTRKTAPFGAMQACDLFNDSIIVVNGLGNSSAPNYCKVYDINGVVTGQYILPDIMRTGEPEGVFFDRNTCDIYISKENKDIYKIIG